MKKTFHNQKITLFTALFSMLVGVALGAFFHKETVVVREGTADTPAAMSSVNLMIDDGTTVRTWNTVSWHETMSATGLLEAVAGANEITLFLGANKEKGSFVSSIDGIGNDDTARMRWQYWVNNVYEPRPAGRYYLKPGDIVLWKYAKEQQ